MNELPQKHVPITVSLLTYFGMLFAAMLLLVDPRALGHPETWVLAIQSGLCFPCGLGLLSGAASVHSGAGLGALDIAAIFISYASVVAFLVAFTRRRSWLSYGTLCLGFVVLLLLNVAGCHELDKGLPNMQ